MKLYRDKMPVNLPTVPQVTSNDVSLPYLLKIGRLYQPTDA